MQNLLDRGQLLPQLRILPLQHRTPPTLRDRRRRPASLTGATTLTGQLSNGCEIYFKSDFGLRLDKASVDKLTVSTPALST